MRGSVVEFNRADRMSKMREGVYCLLILWTIVHMATAQVTEFDLDIKEEICEPGSKWEEDCNTCFCTENGLAACTSRACHTMRIDLPRNECVPNTRWKEDCNSCFCTRKGWAACTRMACPKTKRAVPRRDCVPGTTWRAECNNCVCTENGRAICTLRACPPTQGVGIVKGWK